LGSSFSDDDVDDVIICAQLKDIDDDTTLLELPFFTTHSVRLQMNEWQECIQRLSREKVAIHGQQIIPLQTISRSLILIWFLT